MTRPVVPQRNGLEADDTQTSSSVSYPAGHLAWLQNVPGDRYEYELCPAARPRPGLVVEQVEIATVYEPTLSRTSGRCRTRRGIYYAPLLRFMGTSLASFGIDWLGVADHLRDERQPLAAGGGGGLISGTANFMNRRVFRARRACGTTAWCATRVCSGEPAGG